MPAISIHALEPALLEDYLDFFDRRAFADNPDWSDCYCRCFKTASREEWSRLGAEENRAAAERDISAGKMRGYLAFSQGRAVGWCASDGKAAFPMLSNFPGALGPGDEAAAAIVCLIVEKGYRRTGIARSLVAAAIEGARKEGRKRLEAYPRKPKDGEPLSDAEAFPGPFALYESLGFGKLREIGDRIVMSLNLA